MPLHWPSWFLPRLDWLQVEVSSHCNAACLYCPHTLYRDTWQNRILPVEMFRQLVPILARTRLVYLQGWGEPLTNPQFFDLVRIAKTAKCQVGTTTNGMLLNNETCMRLIKEDMDVIAFSLAGMDEGNDSIRQGTHFGQIISTIQTINRFKKQLGVSKPEVHIAYLLFRSQWSDVTRLPELAQELNIHQVVISTLDFVGQHDLAREAIIPTSEEEYLSIRSELNTIVEAGQRNGTQFHYWLAAPPSHQEEISPITSPELDLSFLLDQNEACTENIQRSAFISANGEVSPCVYMNIPVKAANYIVESTEKPYLRRSFGNIQNQAFNEIWRSRPYTAFRIAHRQHNLPPFCLDCNRSKMQKV